MLRRTSGVFEGGSKTACGSLLDAWGDVRVGVGGYPNAGVTQPLLHDFKWTPALSKILA